MPTWHKLSLTMADLAAGNEIGIVAALALAHARAGGPAEVVFRQVDRRVEGIDLYFSGASVEYVGDLVAIYGATPCERPVRRAVRILVGQTDALEVLFPNANVGPYGLA